MTEGTGDSRDRAGTIAPNPAPAARPDRELLPSACAHRKVERTMPAVLEVISNEELTSQKLHEIFRNAYMDAQLDADGDVRLTLDGIKILVTVDQSRKLIHLISIFGVKPGATRQQVLELCNRINDRLILIRAAFPSSLPSPAVMLDHYLVTEAGLTGVEIVDDVRRFRTVISSVPPLNTEQILN
jgi:hypothetical protein